jgi:hypothetical protein
MEDFWESVPQFIGLKDETFFRRMNDNLIPILPLMVFEIPSESPRASIDRGSDTHGNNDTPDDVTNTDHQAFLYRSLNGVCMNFLSRYSMKY